MLRRNSKFSGLISAIALAGVLSMGSASAAIYTSNGTCLLTDISANADACFGSIDANVSDSESLLNKNTFGTDIGLFGHTDWDFLAKQNTPGDLSGTNIGLSVTPTGGSASGNWSVNFGALDIFDRVVLILKAGSTFSSYLYVPGSHAGNSGSWVTSALDGKNLSHFSIYTNSHFSIHTNEISPVPVPAAIWLFGTALLGFISMSRRTKV